MKNQPEESTGIHSNLNIPIYFWHETLEVHAKAVI